MKKLEVGAVVVYVDPVGLERNALVTAVWGDPEKSPSINIAVVSNDATMNDQYGRQIGRQTSIVHQTSQAAPGNYWKFAGE